MFAYFGGRFTGDSYTLSFPPALKMSNKDLVTKNRWVTQTQVLIWSVNFSDQYMNLTHSSLSKAEVYTKTTAHSFTVEKLRP